MGRGGEGRVRRGRVGGGNCAVLLIYITQFRQKLENEVPCIYHDPESISMRIQEISLSTDRHVSTALIF